MPASFVILAAGVGSRYGGPKQLEPVGPSGETLIDYAAFDAHRAGFSRIVLVIRPDAERAFRERIARGMQRRTSVALVNQRLDALPDGARCPPGRTRPWGTAHAVLAAASVVDGRFAVANADDFYGAAAIATLGAFLSETPDGGATPEHALIGFSLRDTLSDAGSVSRAVCRCDADGWLQEIREITKIRRRGDNGVARDEQGREHVLEGDTLVSMNLWAFRPPLMRQLGEEFREFLRVHGDSTSAEFYLPAAVGRLVERGDARVRVLRAPGRWCGMTYRGDRGVVEQEIHHQISAGTYPERLWD
ncbi:MAG: NTP transferase domain-containing protein [Phycisphaerae bacterium]|jgi:hypothetical protein